MKRQSTRYNEASSFTNNLMRRESFRAKRGMGENEYRQGLRVIIYWNVKASALLRGRGETEFMKDTIQQIVFFH